MSSTELSAHVIDLGSGVAGIGLFLPELVTRIKRLEEDRDNLMRKVEEQAALLTLQNANR
jgi:tRNA1(Val) A37 N6-methylase TrmN6